MQNKDSSGDSYRNLQCANCSRSYPFESGLYNCTHCQGIIEVKYSRGGLSEYLTRIFSFDSISKAGVWRFFDLLPIRSKEHIVSLSEGNTPLIKLENLGENTYAKDETRNPTGSFKDRPNTVGISKARELGATKIAIASSGNAAGSLSAYAAKAGIECIVAVPENTPASKLNQIVAFGAKVAKVRGVYSNSFNLIRESCKKFGWHNLTSVSVANPYQSEGDKTVAYEIYEQLDRTVPDWIVVPIGAGPLLVGVWKGFQELKEVGLTRKLPRLVGVQAEGCSPIVRAFKSNESQVTAWENPQTIAHSIADPLVGYPEDGTLTLRKIIESHGVAESVNDSEMLDACGLLARTQGIFAEPAAASSLAVVPKLKRLGIVHKNELVVSLITGTGLKSPEAFQSTRNLPIIDADPTKLAELVN